jgi:hypothetical protein
LKSVNDIPLLANEAASLGSAPAGVKVERGSKLTATAGAFLAGAATAGDNKRPTADTAASSLALLDRLRLSTNDSLLRVRYSRRKLKVP